MPRRGFLDVITAPKALKALRKLSQSEQKQVRAAIDKLLYAELPIGINYKPILPDGYRYEARINLSLRLVIREGEDNSAIIVDICTHDELPKYGR